MPTNSQKLRKPRLGRAVRAPSKVRAPRANGGTTAPTKPQNPSVGAGHIPQWTPAPGQWSPKGVAHPRNGQGKGGGNAPGGSSPGAPQGPGGQAIPESARTANQRAEAASTYGMSEADIKHQMYLAALAFGDPSVIGQYGDVVPTPGGALQMAAKEAEEARRANTMSRADNNTFFSGMNLEDIRHIGDTEALKKHQAQEEWEEALWNLTVALQNAREERESQENDANVSDLEAFESTEPEPQATGGGGGGGQSKPKAGKTGGQSAKAFGSAMKKARKK